MFLVRFSGHVHSFSRHLLFRYFIRTLISSIVVFTVLSSGFLSCLSWVAFFVRRTQPATNVLSEACSCFDFETEYEWRDQFSMSLGTKMILPRQFVLSLSHRFEFGFYCKFIWDFIEATWTFLSFFFRMINLYCIVHICSIFCISLACVYACIIVFCHAFKRRPTVFTLKYTWLQLH